MADINYSSLNASRKHHKPKNPRFIRLRNLLNVVFMIGSIVGLIFYFSTSSTVGTIIILVSMVFKFIEAALRMIR